MLLSLGGAWFLSGRALVPIQPAFSRQQEFVADASHELRTPLTVLRSATDLLNQHRDEPLDANGELFDDMRAEIARMERLAADLLTLARSDRGELELMPAPIELGEWPATSSAGPTPLAHGTSVQLRDADADAQPSIVEADPDRLQQVLLILIDNAIKHTPPGGRVDVAGARDGRRRARRGGRHRLGHRARAPAAHLRPLLSGRYGALARCAAARASGWPSRRCWSMPTAASCR